METAGDAENLKWWLLGYKLPQSALTAKTKRCHLEGGSSVGEGVGKMKRSQDFQNKQLGHGLEGFLFSVFPTGLSPYVPWSSWRTVPVRHEH